MYRKVSEKIREFNAKESVGHILVSTVPAMVTRLILISIIMALLLHSPCGL
jgi:hypothetical protein